MRTKNVLPPNEPPLGPDGTFMRTWWNWFWNMFHDVQDNQGLALEALMPHGPDTQRQIGDIQILAAQRGITQIGELERKVSDLNAFVFAAMRTPQQSAAPSQTTGTWTPLDNSGAALTFTSVSAGFSQIGNMVYAYFTLTYPNTADGSSASIKGLPYLVPNQNYAQVPSIAVSGATISNEVVALPIKGTFALGFMTGNPTVSVVNSTLSTFKISANVIYPAS